MTPREQYEQQRTERVAALARPTRAELHSFLASLKVGDQVVLTRDTRPRVLTVQRELRRTDGRDLGSWDHAAVTVGYGPGRFNTEVTAAGLDAGHYQLERAVAMPTEHFGAEQVTCLKLGDPEHYGTHPQTDRCILPMATTDVTR